VEQRGQVLDVAAAGAELAALLERRGFDFFAGVPCSLIEDLIAALDSGQLSYAALDALWPEPLPPESPLWLHPKVTVMPHVARRPTVAQLVTEVAANIRSLDAGGQLLQEIDVTQGY